MMSRALCVVMVGRGLGAEDDRKALLVAGSRRLLCTTTCVILRRRELSSRPQLPIPLRDSKKMSEMRTRQWIVKILVVGEQFFILQKNSEASCPAPAALPSK
ncbi:hypothetical protein M758_9G047300 [Ceratodon purpureus]|nr:hypothetical protein M758_9G047300 [Ceratodon purpureus]